MTTNFEPPLEPEQKILQDAIDKLMEHFDSIHVFASRYDANDDNNTTYLDRGQGNYYSRYGHTRAWVIEQEERMRDDAHADDD